MSYAIIIRGPLGVGKSTISEILAKKLKAKHFEMDKIFDEYNLAKNRKEGFDVTPKSSRKVNELLVPKIKQVMKSKNPVIIEGNFYLKSQLNDLIKKLNSKNYIFTLKAPVEVCIDRDSKRKNTCGKDAARVVHNKTSEFDEGIIIDTKNKTPAQTINEILRFIE